ncbi:FAD-binding dehydrogenase [Streptomyces europaeiscabiei]|uniref:FAD-binding dehydrogenase n=1 Tax=Streptomyces europaeiscabiei TaxID=146819 RepID=A0ABU4N8M1_9ACTN|nr:FAD-binding dehydrogenase [Streptomyces europaeiscabiei]MDX2523228.1 FAD-binding dehydrogenase [Streptomyces europaeiscabiei]MDX2765549.1 FAD-binding dehydrogenase [Streptomyces europaeiscabiei]MDX2772070.1 FAD-binding dehydrogenase [Streptomyces europaeiscabiei]MDX3542461.1 FAD-binding dehydrogenase [Streptomyces europaeiscabiei]MDX3550327.1 FAD-binding dehydrogenase [Streptomyces europaeiscabiei]
MENSASPDGVSRRRVLTTTGGVLAGAALAAQAAPAFAAGSSNDADAIVVGHGLAGLVATAELAAAGRKVLLLDQEPEASIGGQAFWSFGGLFLVDSAEQRLMGIKDSQELAWQDWLGTAGFDRGVSDPSGQDHWAYKWAEAYVDFASGEKRSWLAGLGVQWFPIVGWAERGGGLADGHGNSVPRFHVTWGTGPAVVAPFEKKVRAAVSAGNVTFKFRHRVDGLVTTNGAVTGVRGAVLEPSSVSRGKASSRTVVGEFELKAPVVVVTSGGIGANHDLVRANWPARLGTAPKTMITGVPAHVDGRMLAITEKTGARIVNPDRMWHYTEGLRNYDPIWPGHGIRILPGPSSMWFSATGKRFSAPDIPGYDTLHTLKTITDTGYDYSWFVTTQKIIAKEFALSGSEQNPDLTEKNIWMLLSRIWQTPEPIEKFKKNGVDFVVASSLSEMVRGMNKLTGENLIDLADLTRQIEARDREIDNEYSKDAQVMGIRNALKYPGDSISRTASAHKIMDTSAHPLIAVRLNILTRKSLGGLQTDLSGRVLNASGDPVPGLYAAGEVAGFGGGGVHGYRSLEGTFLGGCLFSGRQSGKAAAEATA